MRKFTSVLILLLAFTTMCSAQPIQRGHCAAVRKAFTPYTDTLISQAPAGTHYVDQMCETRTINVSTFDEDACVNDYVIGDDGNVYLGRPLPMYSTGYLKLEPLNGDTLIAHMPQLVYIDSWDNSKYYLVRMRGGDTPFDILPDTLPDGTQLTDMKFLLKDDTLRMLNDDEKVMMALVDSTWYFSLQGTVNLKVFKNPYKPLSLPEGAKIERYTLANKQIVNLAFVGDEVYLNDPVKNDSVSWAKGTIDGNKVTFKNAQYLGLYYNNSQWPRNMYHHYFLCTGTYSIDAQTGAKQYNLSDEIVYTLDPETRTLTAPDSSALYINTSRKMAALENDFLEPTLAPYIGEAATPKSPTIVRYEEYDAGQMQFVFNMPREDVDGKFIDTNFLYYSVYINDDESKPLAFVPLSEGGYYEKIDSTMTEFPDNFTDNFDFFAYDDYHIVYIYEPNVKNIGVKAIYKGGNEVHSSAVTWHSPNSIEGVEDNLAAVEKISYYDLAGRRVQSPVHGVYIKVTRFANGKENSQKVIIK
ncbi:MAG: hypothetical protein ACOYJG_05245 [Prevotella sp.]|jgi:hypothetical protein